MVDRVEMRSESPPAATSERWSRAQRAYAVTLFALAVIVLAVVIARGNARALDAAGIAPLLFFLGYGVFTISIGYELPNLGYYSFDRVAQVASILVLGPVDAALVNGAASFIYPWHRLWKGVPVRDVVYAALNNSGLMALIVLIAGSAYVALGGPVPLMSLTGWTVVMLIVLVLGMQLLNDAGMLGLLTLGRRDVSGFFNAFSYALELGSGAAAVLVALVYTNMQTSVFALLLAVLTVGMLALRQFADMRHKLELLVEERTRSLQQKTLELELQATRDNLTGLFNRRYADDYLARELETCRRHRQHFTIALADIDLFKQVNDLHSHATGDAVLRRVAAILRERCRKTDVIARYGGEEFLICFPHTEVHEARGLCEELRAAVEKGNWAQLGLAVAVTISFGIAEYRSDPSPDGLVSRADPHLYAAKNGGRNLVVA